MHFSKEIILTCIYETGIQWQQKNQEFPLVHLPELKHYNQVDVLFVKYQIEALASGSAKEEKQYVAIKTVLLE